MRIYQIAAGLFIFAVSTFLLKEYSAILIPFVIAIGARFFFNAIANKLDLVKIRSKSIPLWVRYLITAGGIGVFIWLVSGLISNNIASLTENIPVYQENFLELENKLLILFNIKELPGIPPGTLDKINIGALLGSVFEVLTAILGNTFLIIIYVIFLLIEQRTFGKKMYLMFTDDSHGKLDRALDRINDSIEQYIFIKTGTSLMTGILSYFVLVLMGVDFAFFWAFLIFVLNYIPSVGSIIATLFPVVLAIIQFDTLGPALGVLLGVGAIQVLVGNFLEPRWLGKSLKISGLAVLLSLVFWNAIWGPTGMFLCVPITVVFMIVFNNFESTKAIAVLLSEDGEF